MIEIQQLSKSFTIPRKQRKKNSSDPREQGSLFVALRDITFSAQTGSILGLLGPNGAGKTTLLRILSTALQPSSGRILIDGKDISNDPLAIRRKIGFLTGNTGLYDRLTPRELLTYFGKLHQIENGELKRRIDGLFHELDMLDFADKRCEKLSFGMKQKVSIARTLIHQPEVIVLDEPTTGLDVAASQTILRFIERLSREGKTVLFSTHHMHEVEVLCNHVVIIHEGAMRFEGTVSEMRGAGGRNLAQAFLHLIGAEVRHAA